jgi:uncharacterized membrane protein
LKTFNSLLFLFSAKVSETGSKFTDRIAAGFGLKFWQPLRLLAFALILLASTSATAQSADSAEPAEILTFIGRFHPLLVHLPIGFLFVAFLLEIFSRFNPYRELRHAVTFILLLGVISSGVSAVMGYFLSLGGGYEEDTLFWHQWLGIGVAVTALLAWVIKRTLTAARLFREPELIFPFFCSPYSSRWERGTMAVRLLTVPIT